MNTENTATVIAGYVDGLAGPLRVAVWHKGGDRRVTFLKSTQDPADRGPWVYAYDGQHSLVSALRAGTGILLQRAAPFWGYPEWSLYPLELERAVRMAAKAFAQMEARRGYACDACGATGLAADEFIGAACVDCVAPIGYGLNADGEEVRA